MAKVHFIAIGGSVMHQLAIALHHKGYQVTGSDDEIFEPALSNLKAVGILPATIGWDEARITPDLDAVILGMHARADNPELLKAQALGLKIYSFPGYIFQESQDKKRVVVGGSHGKTTTTSMIMHALQQQHLPFDYLVGAKLEGFAQSVQVTDAPLIICEGDEYPASPVEKRPKFHFLHPHIAILTGIAWDHINVFPTFENYEEQFAIFIRLIAPGGVLIYNETDPVLKALVEKEGQHLRLIPYGIPTHMIHDGITNVTFGAASGDLQIFGDHNLMNLNAARLVCAELGIGDADFLHAMQTFKGAAKRLELIGKNDTCAIYRDFAHAPSKVKATIAALKNQYPNRRLIGVLELHTYSSLNKDFLGEYHGAMDPADVAIVYYSKHALEIKRLPELSADLIVEGFAKPGLIVMNDRATLENFLDAQQYDNTNLLMMSSGTYDGMEFSSLKKYL
ncbi:UDP-N-acetylmuramate: L-alanyl-gamma-D-glutamyl-meso-diaminopimelate ligase [Chitinophaga skermanii]|uniref:UDP-N-acetylmuramate: L-alanyl-gamma-D-glutamyl-meso-diaminopimelate ligase n=1 Tax=Chitinophaga skermanii TaxID=331697 RepID=A0A327QN84_9BACT|nr:Mur ligase family protein [Chitinophaga skermanii]RAJ05112.1 UDP-N-acetylmuramate: L-alanyl-gamma-D-glutamyl-meso-diaminopimelate ligase [Chitinophaga skermanii]